MVVDSSALLAILLEEDKHEDLVDALEAAETRFMGAPTMVEASAVILGRNGRHGLAILDALLLRLRIETVEMSPEAAEFARAAYAEFGKGVGSPPVLNYGDCLSYGVARALGEPLLFVGDDFPQTDVTPAL